MQFPRSPRGELWADLGELELKAESSDSDEEMTATASIYLV